MNKSNKLIPKNLVSFLKVRGVQLLSRYIGMVLMYLVGKYQISISPEDVNKFSMVGGLTLMGVICFGIDHLMHHNEKKRNKPDRHDM